MHTQEVIRVLFDINLIIANRGILITTALVTTHPQFNVVRCLFRQRLAKPW